MKSKVAVIRLCTLLAVLTGIVLVSTHSKLPAFSNSKNQLIIAPDGTIEVPRNDNMTIIAHLSKVTNSVSPGTNVPRR